MPDTTTTAAPAPDVRSRGLTIPAEDGTPLAATLFEPGRGASPDAALIVLGPAAAVPSRYYARFAGYLAARGHAVATFDYRGIGGSRSGSLKGSRVRMRDWCVNDVPGVIAWAADTFPRSPLHWIGHSMGGFATGLAHNNDRIARQLNIATLSGYWGRMTSPERYRVKVLMGYVSPPVVRALGFFPGVLMGGEDMPGPAYLEWAAGACTPSSSSAIRRSPRSGT
jgi:predicted alpha/beta hydrolase